MSTLPAAKYLILCARIVLGVVFIVASIDKIAAPDAFAGSIQAYRILPMATINTAALILAWLELLCGIFLLSGFMVKPSALIVSALLAVFLAAMLLAMARGLAIDCGCFGKEHATPLGWMKIAEDTGLLLLGILLWYFPSIPAAHSTGEESLR